MKLRFLKKLNIILAIALSFAITMTYVPQSVYAVSTFNDTFIQSYKPHSGANEWQIIDRSFPGRYDGSDVSLGFDERANTSYSIGDGSAADIRMSNSVLSTNTENEFMMYTCIEPRVSWQEVLELNTIECTNAGNGVTPPAWLDSGHVSYLVPDEDSTHHVPIYLRYYADTNSNGKHDSGEKYLTDVITMWANTQNVPNGTAAFGNPLITSILYPGSPNGTFGGVRKFSISGGETVEVPIDALIYNRFDFADKPVRSKEYTATVGDHIEIYKNSFNYRGDSCTLGTDGITWDMDDVDLGKLSYTIKDNKVIIDGVLRSLDNGKVTYYRKNAYEMTYNFSLNVTDAGFVSCKNGTPTTDTTADFANQVTVASDDSSKAAKLTYKVDGQTTSDYVGYLNPNFVKGLLYDLEFDKVIKDTDAKLEGAKFKLTRIKGDGSGTYSDTRTYTTADMISKEDGSVKFRNMPWGYYKLEEIDINNMHAVFDSDVDKDYFPDSNLGTVPAKDTYGDNGLAAVGWVIRNNNADGYITADHSKMHLADLDSDVNKMLYTFTPDKWNKRKGKVENEPYWTIIQPEKEVLKYDDLTAKLKNESFKITTKDYTEEGDSDKVFLYGDDFTKISLPIFNKESNLQHAENDSFRIMLPKNGAYIDVSETLTDKQKKHFEYVETIAKAVKGSVGDVAEFESSDGAKVKVLAGTTANPVTTKLIVKNRPFTLVKLKKAIDNYKSQLADDEFIISLTDTKGLVDTQAVLKHNEESGIIKIYDATTLQVDETMPMEYSFGTTPVTAKVNDENKTVTNKKLATELGEVVELTVHNKYDWQPYFHDFDTVTNDFRP